MGSPGVVEGTQTIRYYWLALSWPWLLQPPRPNLRPLLLPRLMLIPGMDTTATPGLMPMVMDTGLMAMDTTTERGLLMPSPLLLLLLRLMLPLRLRLTHNTVGLVCCGHLLLVPDGTVCLAHEDLQQVHGIERRGDGRMRRQEATKAVVLAPRHCPGVCRHLLLLKKALVNATHKHVGHRLGRQHC